MIVPSRMKYRKQVQQSNNTPKHWLTTVLGIIAAVVLFVCALAQTTVLNEQYMTNQIVSSTVSDQIQNDINSSLSSYGIDTQVINTKQTRKILKQVVHQVYEGKSIHINIEDVMNNDESKLGNTLSSYGVPSALISQLPTGSVNEQISSVVNNRLNNSEIQQLETGIKIARVVTFAGLIISVAILLLIVTRNLFTKTIIRDFRWITLLSSGIFALLLMATKKIIQEYSSDMASFANVIHNISENVLSIGWQMVMVDIGLSIVLFIISLVLSRQRS